MENPWLSHPFNHKTTSTALMVIPLERARARASTPCANRPFRLQEEYVRRVIAAVADHDNVLFEVCNGAMVVHSSGSTTWCTHWSDRVQAGPKSNIRSA